MKTAVFYEKGVLKIEDRPIPEISDDEVLVRVRACGVCGTDIHIFCGEEGAAKTPSGTVLGHEFAGEVAQIGRNVRGLLVGDRVSVDPNKLCGYCEYCRKGLGHFCTGMVGIGTTTNGGFAEYCAVPASQVYKVSESLSFEEAAMAEPISCCLHGIDLCNIKCGSTVAVIGCGMIGLLMVQLAKLSGAARVIAIEPVAEKRQKALEFGADMVIDPLCKDVATALKMAGYTQIDVVIECVGKTQTIQQAIDIAGKYSVVMMFGLTAPDDEIRIKPFEFFKKEITLGSSYINPYTFPAAINLLESGKLDVTSMVYRKAPLSELPKILANPEKRSAGKNMIVI
ncbi:MAG: zinc-dependent alcohol dehydrogenase family protein [Firmicutes bacterium]|nr:zinc-dependent alcohol dehydrogenase family protein [Bacillota bacterium]